MPADRDALGEFIAGQGFALDPFQLDACAGLAAGRSVLVAAPTGSGKTVIGEFAVGLAADQGQRAFYTTPIKALSNQKFRDFATRFGPQRVGLLTGDTVINSGAAIVVMTTEVLRNMLYEASPALLGLATVVMDEVHYLADRERGAVWEEVILHLPESVRLAALSATVSNAEEFGAWLNEVRGETQIIVSEIRPVPLEQQVLTETGLVDLFVPDSPTTVNPMLVRKAADRARALRSRSESGEGSGRGRRGGRGSRISRPAVLDRLRSARLLPALIFIFSRAACEDAVRQCLIAGVRLTSGGEAAAIRELVDARCAQIPDEDLAVLGYHSWRDGLERGLAAHHAGMLPLFKETVEELFTHGLVKAVFATETLALGINMPARSVVLERLIKWDGQAHVDVTAGQYTQLTGRAGRRGIDDVGFAVVVWHEGFDPRQLAGLASTRTYPLRSSFRPSYNMAVNLVDRIGASASRELLETSFAQFQADRSVVGVAAQIHKHEDALAGYLEAMQCELGDFAQYSQLRQELSELEKRASRDRAVARRADVERQFRALRPGDVIYFGQGRRVVPSVVIAAATTEAAPKPQVLTIDRRVRRLVAAETATPPVVVGELTLPRAFDARSANARRELARALDELGAQLPRPKRSPSIDETDSHDDDAREIAKLRASIRSHACHHCPDRDQHVRWAQRYHKLATATGKLRATMRRRSGNVASQFDRVCALLFERGYLARGVGVASTRASEADADSINGAGGTTPHSPDDEFVVTAAGAMLASLHADQDLLMCEALRAGTCGDLSASELAAFCSALVFESRAATADATPPRLPPSGPLRAALFELDELAADLAEHEARHHLDFIRLPDSGLVRACWGWANGEPLHRVLATGDLTAGDFVRSVRQVIDLLGQVEVASRTEGASIALAETSRSAKDQLRRGVVAYSSVGE